MISVPLPSPQSQLFYLLPQLKNKQWYCRHEPEINTTLRIIKFSKEEIYQPLTPKISLAILLTTGHIILDVSSENLVLDQLIIPKLILFFILIASLLDIVLITSGEILFWSLIGVKGLTVYNTVNALNVGEGEEGGIWSHGLIIERLNWWWLLPRMSIIIADNSPSWIKMELDCVFKNCGAVLVRNYSNIILALSTELIM